MLLYHSMCVILPLSVVRVSSIDSHSRSTAAGNFKYMTCNTFNDDFFCLNCTAVIIVVGRCYSYRFWLS